MERITRQRLYDLAWSEPMSALGPRHGISGVAFAKACRTHDIPVPPRGYWAKARVGKRLARPPLPPRPLGGVETIELGRRRWQSNAIPDKDLMTMEIPSPPDFPEALPDLTVRVQRLVGKVTVPKNLDKPHRLIAKLLDADEVRRGEKRSYFSAPLFASPFEQRRLRLLSGLFWALGRVAMHPSLTGKDPDSFDARVGDQHVTFKLDGLGPGHRIGYRSEAELRRPASEKLKLEISRHLRGMESVPHVWQDQAGDPIEHHATDIVVALIVSGEMQYRLLEHRHHDWLVQRKARAIENERQRLEDEQREALEKRVQAENERVQRLLGEAAAYRQASDIRAYVETVRQTKGLAEGLISRDEIEGWATWATAQADRIDPIRSRAFLLDLPPLDGPAA